MKQFRKIACLVLAFAMMLSLAACGGFPARMARAARKMEKLQSYRMDLEMDMEMSLSVLGQSMDMSLHLDGVSDVNTEPMKMKMDMSMEMMGENARILSYGEKDADSFVSYVSPDGGATWGKQTLDGSGIPGYVDKKDFGMLLKLAQRFEKSGTETVRGSEALVYTGNIEGAEIEEAIALSGVLDSMYESLGLDPEDVDVDVGAGGSIPTAIAIDKKSGMIVRYTMDMSEIMQNLLPAVMEQLLHSYAAQSGLEGFDLSMLGFKLEIGKVFVTAEFYDFDAVGTIEIPREARDAEELGIAA